MPQFDNHGASLFYETSGAGRPLLLIAGLASDMASWGPLPPLLTGRQLIMIDNRGCGRTRSEGAIRIDDMADDCRALLDHLGIAEVDIVGHSMGGMIAAEMAALAPNDVSKLALICPAGLWMDDHPIPDMFALLPYEMPKYMFHDAEKGAAMMTAGRSVEDPNFLQNYLVTNARQLGMAGKILFPIPERGLAERLYRVKAKTVIVWGESDRMIPPVYGPAFKAGIKGSTLVSVPEAGHMVLLEQTDAVVGAIAKVAA